MPRNLTDLTGERIGSLTVVSYNGIVPVGNTTQSSWECLCDCGNTTIVLNNNLRKRSTLSCGCLQAQRAFESNLIDHTDEKHGLLTVISYAETRNKNAYWNCVCECGNECVVAAMSFPKTKSCGCKQGNFVHGEWSKGYANYAKFRRNDPLIKLKHNVSSSIRSALKNAGKTKAGQKTFECLPYSAQELKDHIESLWESWMNWDNYGGSSNDPRKTWHIDHIKPHCDFNYKSLKDKLFVECWSLSNLRPLEKKKNMSKGCK